MGRNQQELQEQSRGLMEQQVPMVSTAIGLAAVFVGGVVLIALGISQGISSSMYWIVGIIIGVVFAAVAIIGHTSC